MKTLRRASLVTALLAVMVRMPAAQEPSRSALLAQARRALAGGQVALAIRTVEPLLATAPGDREVVDLIISASLSIRDSSRAYATYDGFAQAIGQESASALRPIAIYELRQVVAESVNDPRLRAEALERLARGGDAAAAADLRGGGRGWPGQQALLADAALSRLGDENATKRIVAAVAAPDEAGKVPAAEAVVKSGNTSLASALVPLLKHQDPRTRIAAVDGLAAFGYTGALDEMRALLSDPFIEVRSRTALALARLGDSGGQAIIAAMLRSPVGDVRLRALDADRSIGSAERMAMVRTILSDPEPLTRVMAAEILAKDDPVSAKPVLVALMKHPDLLVRLEAGRVLEALQPADVALYRGLLGDREPWVRMYAAGGVLRAAASPGLAIRPD